MKRVKLFSVWGIPVNDVCIEAVDEEAAEFTDEWDGKDSKPVPLFVDLTVWSKKATCSDVKPFRVMVSDPWPEIRSTGSIRWLPYATAGWPLIIASMSAASRVSFSSRALARLCNTATRS